MLKWVAGAAADGDDSMTVQWCQGITHVLFACGQVEGADMKLVMDVALVH